MNTTKRHALQIITGTTGGWQYAETVREVRPSCLDTWRLKEQLRAIGLGDTDVIAGLQVYRVSRPHTAPRYIVNNDGIRRTFEQVWDMVSAKTEVAA